MALGIGEGFKNTMNDVQKEMQKVIPTDFETNLNSSLNSSDFFISKSNPTITSDGIFEKLDSILSLLEYYIPALQNRQLCLDTGVLVGELTPPINKEFAKIEISRERGR